MEQFTQLLDQLGIPHGPIQHWPGDNYQYIPLETSQTRKPLGPDLIGVRVLAMLDTGELVLGRVIRPPIPHGQTKWVGPQLVVEADLGLAADSAGANGHLIGVVLRRLNGASFWKSIGVINPSAD